MTDIQGIKSYYQLHQNNINSAFGTWRLLKDIFLCSNKNATFIWYLWVALGPKTIILVIYKLVGKFNIGFKNDRVKKCT